MSLWWIGSNLIYLGGLLFLFWLVMLMLSIVNLRSLFMKLLSRVAIPSVMFAGFFLTAINLPLASLLFISAALVFLGIWTHEERNTKPEDARAISLKESLHWSVLILLLFCLMFPLIFAANTLDNRHITDEDALTEFRRTAGTQDVTILDQAYRWEYPGITYIVQVDGTLMDGICRWEKGITVCSMAIRKNVPHTEADKHSFQDELILLQIILLIIGGICGMKFIARLARKQPVHTWQLQLSMGIVVFLAWYAVSYIPFY